MGERRFRVYLRSGCLHEEATGVMVKGEDGRWRYWLEFAGRVRAGEGAFPATRVGHAALKARATIQFEQLVWPRRRRAPEDLQ